MTIVKPRLNSDKTFHSRKKDTPHLALMGELWDIFRELLEQKWPRYIESVLYRWHITVSTSYLPMYNTPITRIIALIVTAMAIIMAIA